MSIARFEKNGQVAFSDGSRVLKVPSEAACKERLFKLLESVYGEVNHETIKSFWKERSRDMSQEDELQAECAKELFQRLDKIWNEMLAPPPQVPVDDDDDVFSSFGM